MTEADEIRALVTEKGITRLCHFTPFRNLLHIAAEGIGLLPTSELTADERAVYNRTDLKRLDGHPDHICASIEYPNAWFFRKARAQEQLFKDWVVLLISPKYLWSPETLFTPRNAAAGYGAALAPGLDSFKGMYAPKIVGAYNRVYERTPSRLAACPTDDQAEVLIPKVIGLDDILGVAVQSREQALAEQAALRLSGISRWRFPFVLAPAFFNPEELRNLISAGTRPTEHIIATEQ